MATRIQRTRAIIEAIKDESPIADAVVTRRKEVEVSADIDLGDA